MDLKDYEEKIDFDDWYEVLDYDPRFNPNVWLLLSNNVLAVGQYQNQAILLRNELGQIGRFRLVESIKTTDELLRGQAFGL